MKKSFCKTEFTFTNDFELIEALKNAESKAFNYLFNTYYQKLCIYGFSLTKDHYLSEDIVQSVFMKFWCKRQLLKNDFIVKRYLYKSVYNEFIDYYRKRKSVLVLENIYIDALLTTTVEEENGCYVEKLMQLVNKEIQNLPPKCRRAFLLRKEEGLSNIETAKCLKVSVKCVEAHITKAYGVLRKRVV